MIKQYSYGDIVWYDLESPKPEEIDNLARAYQLDPLVKEELLTPTLKPRVDTYENCMYVILHFPAFRSSLRGRNREIDFVIGDKFIITTHYDNVDPLHQFAAVFGSKDFLNTQNAKNAKTEKIHAGHVFYQMIQYMYRSLLSELEILGNVLGKAEKNLFVGQEKSMLIALSKINRDLLDFKTATSLHKTILESFEEESASFYGKGFQTYPKEILNEYYKVHAAMEDSKEFLEELRRTNDSLLSNKQNEIMKTVTVIAFIFLPLSLIASVFGMNIENMPIVSDPHSFQYITGGMLVLAVVILVVAKYKEWL